MSAELLLSHFEQIVDTPDAIDRLKRFVLDLAIRGKLIPQDARDEPASTLLEKIAREKSVLLKSAKFKNHKSVSTPSEIPFSIPSSWQWTQLAEIGILSPRNDQADTAKASFVPMQLISAEYGVQCLHEVRFWGEVKKGYTHFAEGDVGLAKITPCFENGKSTVFRNLTGGIGSGTTELHILRPLLISADYILLVLKSSYFIEGGIPKMTGTAGQKRVPLDYFAHSPIPLPPFFEQQRIVTKVGELMTTLDKLKSELQKRQTQRQELLQSLINAALHPVQFKEEHSTIQNRRAIGCYAISKLAGRRSFGRTAEMKIFFLAEAWIGLSLGGNYLREAAGPFDKWIYSFEGEGTRNGWFTISEKSLPDGHKLVQYSPGPNLAEKAMGVGQNLTPIQLEQLDKLLTAFANLSTEKIELIATLFAAWNDFLINDQMPADESIVYEVRNNWHPRKQRFSERQLQDCLDWMRDNGIVPTGKGPTTKHQRALLPT